MILDVLVQTIIQYLGAHKRLVVPQLGAFMVKTPGQNILFSELLRTDDGVLRGLLCDAGMSELEAAGAIDRFVFEVRHAVQNADIFMMPGFGVLRAGASSTITFDYDPTCGVVCSHTEPEAPSIDNDFNPATKPKLSASVRKNPEPYVKGLRYGKPEKTIETYKYVNGQHRRKVVCGFDKLMIVAVTAAVIALAVIVYGYIRASHNNEPDTITTEQVDITSTEDGSTNNSK